MALLLGSTWVPLARAPGTERAGAGAKSHSMLRAQAPRAQPAEPMLGEVEAWTEGPLGTGLSSPHNQPTSGGIVTPTYT